jgi:hypothetical protein
MNVFEDAFRAAKDVVAQSKTGGAPGVGGDAPEIANASEVLLDLRVPATLETALTPSLQEIGFGLRHSEAAERYGPAKRQFTVAERGPLRRFLIHVPCPILKKYAAPYRDALAAVPYAFPRDSIVCIFSPDCQVVDFTLRQLIERGWEDQGVTGAFIPWQDVSGLQQANAHQRQEMLSYMLRLQNGADAGTAVVASVTVIAAPPPPAARLQGAEIGILQNIIRDLPDFQDSRRRKLLVELAGVDQLLSSVNFEGDPKTVAGEVLLTLSKYGWVNEPPQTHALGLLLSYLLTLSDLAENRKEDLKNAIKKHNLLPP